MTSLCDKLDNEALKDKRSEIAYTLSRGVAVNGEANDAV